MITLLRDAPSSKTNTALSEPIQLASFILDVAFLCAHTGVIVVVAGLTTVVLPVTKINIALDHTGRRQRDDVAHARGNVESLGTGKANETEDDGAGVHFIELMIDDGW